MVERMAAAARAHARRLADLAVEETGYGNAKDKYVKNMLCCDWLPRRMRGMKTVGILREIPEEGSSRSASRWAWWRRFCPPPIRLPPPSTKR